MQCEQTAGGKACTNAGVCGKSANTARLQDELTGAFITAVKKNENVPDKLLLEGLFATLTNVNFDGEALKNSGKFIPWQVIILGTDGDIREG
jgi:hydroxylamine reductase